MDRLQDKDTDQNYTNENTPIICTQEAGKMLVQLDGSHTTATATEALQSLDKKIVKFEVENNEGISQKSAISEMNYNEEICSDFSQCANTNQLEEQSSSKPIFDIYREVDAKIFESQTVKPEEDIELKYFKAAEIPKKPCQFRSIAIITTTCDSKNVACQTQPADQASLNELSLMEISSFTSRSDPGNSLNNYAQPENACISVHGSQQEIPKRPFSAPAVVQQPAALPADRPEAPISFNIVTIENDYTPSLTELRRPPLCHRLWDVFCDFCAATFLCLQVNRDFIFCLGFFAAFVVSASFLTAFFYHTLVMSPALWLPDENFRP